MFVARDGLRAQAFIEALAFAAPEIEALYLPSWDCQPYDRVSPNAAISARSHGRARPARLDARRARAAACAGRLPSMAQRSACRPKAFVAASALSAAPGNVLDMADLVRWLESNAFSRASVVTDVGDYAQRGGILDLYPPGQPAPIRLDFFGDALESIRTFDPETQRSTGQLRALDLAPMSEAQLTTDTIRRFRQGYAQAFGAPRRGDALYETLSEGRRAIGLEHWLPLFYDELDTLFDYAGGAPVVLDARADEAAASRFAQVQDYYQARKSADEADAASRRLQAAETERALSDDQRMEGAAQRAAARSAVAVRGGA